MKRKRPRKEFKEEFFTFPSDSKELLIVDNAVTLINRQVFHVWSEKQFCMSNAHWSDYVIVAHVLLTLFLLCLNGSIKSTWPDDFEK